MCPYRDSSTRFSASGFLRQWTQYGPLIHALYYFRIRFRIREDIKKIMCIGAVRDGAKTTSALLETALSHIYREREVSLSAVSEALMPT
jgi:hypothetical protein